MDGPIYCPRCDGQGIICEGAVNATGQDIFICDECDALWLSLADIGTRPHVDASEFLKSIGGKGEPHTELSINWGGEIITPRNGQDSGPA
jgi:hypothetical protein